jgi:hypothetical protein
MEMDAVAAEASAPTTLSCSTIDQGAVVSTQSTATAPAVPVNGKKEMTSEARAAESKKRAARRVVVKQKEKDRKIAEEKARQAKILQSVHARATAEALAKQAAVHAIAMLKGEVVTQFSADQFGSTTSSVLSTAAGWYRPASLALSSTREPAPQPAAPSRLGVPMSPEVQSRSSPSSTSTARLWWATHRRGIARLHERVPPKTCPTWPTSSVKCQRSPWATRYCPGLLLWPIGVVVRATIPIANMQDATQANDEDCTITGVETQHRPACSNGGEPLFDEALLAATQASWHSHRTGAYTDKEDLMLCDAWLYVGTDPISGAEQKGGTFWRQIFILFILECNHFCGALENVKKRKQICHGVSDLVRCFLLV